MESAISLRSLLLLLLLPPPPPPPTSPPPLSASLRQQQAARLRRHHQRQLHRGLRLQRPPQLLPLLRHLSIHPLLRLPRLHLLPPQLPVDYNLQDKNKKALQFIEDVTAADEVQRRVLTEILCRNVRVEYVRRHGLDGQTDRESFKKTMPVITYEDLQPDVARIARARSLRSSALTPFWSSSPSTEHGGFLPG